MFPVKMSMGKRRPQKWWYDANDVSNESRLPVSCLPTTVYGQFWWLFKKWFLCGLNSKFLSIVTVDFGNSKPQIVRH